MRRSTRSLLMALPLTLSLAAAGPSPWDFGAKFGIGETLGTPGEQHARGSLRMGLVAEYRLGASGAVFAELVYRSFRTYTFEATRFGTGITPTGATGEISKWTLDPSAGLPRSDGRYDSVDIRKNLLEGLGLNLGYRHPVQGTPWSFQGGVSLCNLKSTQEATGSLKVVTNRSGSKPVVLSTEDMLLIEASTRLRPGCFGGVRADLTPNLFMEGNLALVGFTEVNHLPSSYTGRPASTELRNRVKPVLEINAGIRF